MRCYFCYCEFCSRKKKRHFSYLWTGLRQRKTLTNQCGYRFWGPLKPFMATCPHCTCFRIFHRRDLLGSFLGVCGLLLPLVSLCGTAVPPVHQAAEGSSVLLDPQISSYADFISTLSQKPVLRTVLSVPLPHQKLKC